MTIYKGLRYYKYVYEDWQQPVLTANGTMGGDSFAVSASSTQSGNDFYKAFDGNITGTRWQSANSTDVQWLSFYNPKPLRVTALEIYNYYNVSDQYTSFYIKEAIIQGCDDGASWENIKTITSSTWVEKIIVDLSDNKKAYKYYRVYVTDRAYYNTQYCSLNINELVITAQQLTDIIESTKDDYDYATPIKILDSGRGVFVGSKNTNCLTYTPKHVDVELNPLNANVTGTWGVIADGVAKGFSAANYLTLPEVFNPESNTWEVVVKFTTGTNITSDAMLLSANGNAYRHVHLYIKDSKLNVSLSSNGSSWNLGTIQSTNFLEASKTYYAKVNFTGNDYNLYYSLNGDDYILIGTITNSTPIYANPLTQSIGLNKHSSGAGSPFLGSIDLSQSYININGERWWSGDNYNKVGSWIENGVVGSFTSANYLKLPEAFSPEDKSWETVIEFTTNDKVSTDQGILGGLGDYEGCTPLYIASSKWVIYLSSNGSSWNIADNLTVMPLLANTKYKCKVEFTGNEYVCSSYNFDTGEWEVKKTIASTSTIYGGLTQQIGTNRGKGQPFLGTIDLTQSYIKINDEIWWQGGTGDVTLKAGSKLFVPNGFSDYDYYKYQVTKVGTPSLYHGVASGFTTANYLTLPEVFNPLGSEFEVVFKVNLNTLADNPLLSQNASVQFPRIYLDIQSTGKILFGVGNNSKWVVKLIGNIILETGKDYWIKFAYKEGIYYIYYSLNGSDYVLDNSLESTNTILELTAAATIGFTNDSGSGKNSFKGSIDLKQSYIKINDELWWSGAEIVTPDDYDFSIGKGEQLFNELVIPNDTSAQSFANSEQVVCYNPTTNRLCFVGNDVYDTANNVMNDNISFPVARCTADNTSITSIDEVFDWCGRIGNTAFVLPNVKGLIAKGYKDTGTYNSTEFTVKKVLTVDVSDVVTDRSLLLGSDKLDYVESTYNKVDNLLYNTDGEVINAVECGKVTSDGTAITSLTPYTAQPLTTAIPIGVVFNGSDIVYLFRNPATFIPSAEFQEYKVPSFAHKIHVDCVASSGGASGGNGGRVECDLDVEPNQTLYIFVGGKDNAYNASDIRTDITGATDTVSLQSRLVVAGGGGWNGNGKGGAGGGLTGAAGRNYGDGRGGGGGTQTGGGGGGGHGNVFGRNGAGGSFGLGGGSESRGGAGWYGGGGGGRGWYVQSSSTSGGAGGGSSYTVEGLCTNVIHTQGYQTGDGYITITLVG